MLAAGEEVRFVCTPKGLTVDDTCVPSDAMNLDIWHVVETACNISELTDPSLNQKEWKFLEPVTWGYEAGWFLVSSLFRNHSEFCVSEAICKEETEIDSEDKRVLIDDYGTVEGIDVDPGDEDDAKIVDEINTRLANCQYTTIDPELSKFLETLAPYRSESAFVKAVFTRLTNTNQVCRPDLVDKYAFFLSRVGRSALDKDAKIMVDNRLTRLAFAFGALSAQTADLDNATAHLKRVFGDCFSAELATQFFHPTPVNKTQELENYVLMLFQTKSTQAPKAAPEPARQRASRRAAPRREAPAPAPEPVQEAPAEQPRRRHQGINPLRDRIK